MDLRWPEVGVALLLLVLLAHMGCSSANVLTLEVNHKFAGRDRNLSAFRAHDMRRHARILSAVDIIMGGSGDPADTGLYFARIAIGNPSKDFYVQVDTGSDILWVNCAGCDKCPTKSDLGIQLTLYDPKSSTTSDYVYCDEHFCTSTYNGPLPGCKPNLQCQYNIVYGDGSSTAGYFVKDVIHLDRVSGNFQTGSTNGTVIFGCGAKQSGGLGSSSEALDGIVGFGQANSSMLSQLAAAGKVKRVFSHCLDNVKGGGIFAIGEVQSPKVRKTAMVPNQAHYNVVLKEIQVGTDRIALSSGLFGLGDQKGTIIDSGTTLAYLPEDLYNPLITKIIARQPGLKLHIVEDQFTCFQYVGNVDDGFPTVKLIFEDSLSMTVYPHEYLFQVREDVWCFGWQNGGLQSKDSKDMILLGDLVLSNKLVVYDIENQTIGWTEYNCSSSIMVKDDVTGKAYAVGAHELSTASQVTMGGSVTFFLSMLIALMLSSFL